MENPTPPRWVETLLDAVLPPGEVAEGLIGDLGEEFDRRARARGRSRAALWYLGVAARTGVTYAGWRLWRRISGGREPGTPADAPRKEREMTGMGWESIRQDLHTTIRSARHNPGFFGMAVLTLTLGIAATTASFSLLDSILLRPLPYAQPEELVEVRELGEGRRFFPSFPNFLDFREQSRTFDGMIALQPMGSQPVLELGDPVRLPVVAVTSDYTGTVGVTLVAGRDLGPAEHEPGGSVAGALVSHRLWRERMGGEPDLDRLSFSLFGQTYSVLGVLPPGFEFLYEADIYISAERWPGTVRSAHSHRVVGRLAGGVTLDRADEDLDDLAARLKREHGDDTNAESAQLTPLTEVLLGGQRRPLGLVVAAGAILLLIACANLASALLARGAGRVRELAVRSSLGAGRRRLVRQLMTESLVIALVSCVLGIVLAWAAVDLVSSLGQSILPRMEDVRLSLGALAVATGSSIAAALLFGTLPAVRLTSGAAAGFVRTGSRGGSHRRGRAWDALIAGEVALTLVLLAGAGLLTRSLHAITTMDSGWEAEGVLEMAIQPPNGTFESLDEARAFLQSLEADLAGLAGVTDAGITNFGPLDAGNWTAPVRDTETETLSSGYAGYRTVTDGYFRALRMDFARGRPFERGETSVAVINETLARDLFGDGDPIGRMVRSNFDDREQGAEVVGVVSVARDWRSSDGQPEIFMPLWDVAPEGLEIRFMLRTDGDPLTLIGPARDRVRALQPRTPVEFSTLESGLRSSTADRRFVAGVLLAFAGVALLLALVGVFGVVGYSVAQQRREIGIRLALGASRNGVRARARRTAAAPVGLGIVVGIAVALALSDLVEALLYDTPARDPMLLLGLSAVFLTGAFVASDVPARRTTRIDPARVLRDE